MISILSANQKRLLKLLGEQKSVAEHFYLTGGTALAEYYLHHRYSEDLDFFSEQEFDPIAISVLLKKIQAGAGISQISLEQSFNRNIFLLELKGEALKTEFTYFPFPRIGRGPRKDGISIDSLLDIAVNKIFTVYEKPRARDFIDLYCILRQEKEWTLEELAKKAQVKFDHFLDPLQLAAQCTTAETLTDYPRMINALPEKDWRHFFTNVSKELSRKILS